MQLIELAVVDSEGQPAATCATCGLPVSAGSGVTALFHGRTLRFRCAGCLSRFVLDADHAPEPEPSSTPFTEWCV